MNNRVSVSELSNQMVSVFDSRRLLASMFVGYTIVGIAASSTLFEPLNEVTVTDWDTAVIIRIVFALIWLIPLGLVLCLMGLMQNMKSAIFLRACGITLCLNLVCGSVVIFMAGLVTGGLWLIAYVFCGFLGIYIAVVLFRGAFAAAAVVGAPFKLYNFNVVQTPSKWLQLPSSWKYIVGSLERSSAAKFKFQFSAILRSLALFSFLNVSGWLEVSRRCFQLNNCNGSQTTSECFTGDLSTPAFILSFSVSVAFLLHWGARKIHQSGLRDCLRSASSLIFSDTRTPILFLRPFSNDSLEFAQLHFDGLAVLTGFSNSPRTFDQLLLEDATQYGPVIAIGKPDTKPPILGVSREYVSNSDWQSFVTDWMNKAGAVILLYGSSAGIDWEIRALKNTDTLSKTVFLVPPYTNPQGLLEVLNIPPESISNNEPIVAIIGFGINARIITSSNYLYSTYLSAIHCSLQMLGNFPIEKQC
jgi:hypothetical protein